MYSNLIKENRRVSTCDRLELQTLGCQHVADMCHTTNNRTVHTNWSQGRTVGPSIVPASLYTLEATELESSCSIGDDIMIIVHSKELVNYILQPLRYGPQLALPVESILNQPMDTENRPLPFSPLISVGYPLELRISWRA